MNIKDKILEVYPHLNDDQREAIFNTEGPLLIIAGPGTGKTLVLVLRTVYILLSGKANPSEIVLTTFTEKAAFELRDRISKVIREMKESISLHELKVGTIHGLCDAFISKYINYTPLNRNHVILDDISQHLFIYEHFSDIIGERLSKWNSKWDKIEKAVIYFNKITEEMINVEELLNSNDEFLMELGESYIIYEKRLKEKNRVDFAHLQSIFFNLLLNEKISDKIKSQIRYIMVDEYQDTNYIQEKIFLELSKSHNNLCVVGDEDQALYRFRGATVENILTFEKKFSKKCKVVILKKNYRSHPKIVDSYNKFMNSIKWEEKDGKFYRYPNKKILPDESVDTSDYPAVFSIWGTDKKDEASRVADLIQFLKNNKVIEDYSDVAILLRSVKTKYSGHYMKAFEKYGIPYFCPRAKTYFENEEIEMLLGSYVIILDFHKELFEENDNKYDKTFEIYREYVKEGIEKIYEYKFLALQNYLGRKNKEIQNLKKGESLDYTLMDYFYQLLAYEPFKSFLNNENKARNLSIFSNLLKLFHTYYNVSIITYKNVEIIKRYFFYSFIRFLIEKGLDEYEDPDNPIPKGYVQIMTIHQSKGLEFPVVIVGSLSNRFSTIKKVDEDLKSFYHHDLFEPQHRITEFDRMRHYYVAFSRPQKLLVLTTHEKPKDYFYPIWENLNQWPRIDKELLKKQKFKPKPLFISKKSYSLSSHINVYETCPKQYLFYKKYEFQPSRAGYLLFGTLVHQTIEDIHRMVLEGRKKEITEEKIKEIFEYNYKSLLAIGYRPLAETPKESAFKQVITYFNQNQDLLDKIVETEVDVSVEKDDYIIVGKVDLLMGKEDKFDILDFKTQPKPDYNDPIIEKYKLQLNLYAYIIKERYGKIANKLYIYWTSEESRRNALMELEYDEKLIDEAGKYFDSIVRKIMKEDFDIKEKPDVKKLCKDCDFRYYCHGQGIIKLKGGV